MEKKIVRRCAITQPQPWIGVFGWLLGDKDHIALNTGVLAVVVLLILVAHLCCGAPTAAGVKLVCALVTGLGTILGLMFRAHQR